MPPALLALAIGAFGIGTTEFAVTGLLPEVQQQFGVSAPTAGYLASGYALGVIAGAPLMVVLGARAPRKRMLLILMVLFTLGNALSAAAPTFGLLLVGRVLASLAHGGFFDAFVGFDVSGDKRPPARFHAPAALDQHDAAIHLDHHADARHGVDVVNVAAHRAA